MCVIFRPFRFIKLFRMLFGPAESVNTREIESLGLLAIKIAQMYAARPDILEAKTCQKLANLYENATPLPFSELKNLIPPQTLNSFAELDESPLATASLGQVHLAQLHSGEKVIIKIVRPTQTKNFEKDVAALSTLLKPSVFFYPKLKRLADPIGTLETIRRTTTHEIELLHEISGTKKLAELRDQGQSTHPHLKNLSFAKIHESLSNNDVLVVDFLEAPSVRTQLKNGTFPYPALLELFRIHGYFLFLHGKFHGDLHPGNIHYQDGKFWFIDNANIEEAPVKFTRGLLRFLTALGEENLDDAARAMLDLAESPHPNPELFKEKFHKLYHGFLGKTVSEASLTTQMMNTVKLAVHTGLDFPQGAFPVIKSLMYLDGMALQCGPDEYLLKDVLAFVRDLPSSEH